MLAFLKSLNWTHVTILGGVPLIALYGAFTTQLVWNTLMWSLFYYYLTGMGITAGYHRLWAHRGYEATFPVRLGLCLLGAGSVQGSIRWWCRDHRGHHRYTDTEKDPYSAHHGFWWSHIGWMLFKQDPAKLGAAGIQDLLADPIIRWQHKHYPYIAMYMAFILPTCVAGFGWGDWRGGFFYGGMARLVFVHHATFLVNSLAHYWGDITYDDRHTPRDSIITALLTFGEGYHNFHHEFPSDYRNAIKIYQYDPTKWTIYFLSLFGLTYNLNRFSNNEIQKGRILISQKKLDNEKSKLDWGVSLDELPELTIEQFFNKCDKDNEQLILIDGVVHDISTFASQHPGGEMLIRSGVGKDMSKEFGGKVYDHSNAAHNLLATLRVGKIFPPPPES